jgi:hypothetical protein
MSMKTTVPMEPSAITAAWLSEALGTTVRRFEIEQIGVGVGLMGRLATTLVCR